MFGISFQRSCTANSTLIESLFSWLPFQIRVFTIVRGISERQRPEIQRIYILDTYRYHYIPKIATFEWTYIFHTSPNLSYLLPHYSHRHRGYLSLLRVRGCDLPLNKRIENFRSGADSGGAGLREVDVDVENPGCWLLPYKPNQYTGMSLAEHKKTLLTWIWWKFLKSHLTMDDENMPLTMPIFF